MRKVFFIRQANENIHLHIDVSSHCHAISESFILKFHINWEKKPNGMTTFCGRAKIFLLFYFFVILSVERQFPSSVGWVYWYMKLYCTDKLLPEVSTVRIM